jgi:hypothetical protein
MRMLALALALTGSPIAALAAGADFEARTAADLAKLCAGAEPGAAQRDGAIDFCHGFAQGAVSLELDHAKKAFCFPSPPPSRSATMGEYATWARATPDRQNQPAAASVIAFFKERFPCK